MPESRRYTARARALAWQTTARFGGGVNASKVWQRWSTGAPLLPTLPPARSGERSLCGAKKEAAIHSVATDRTAMPNPSLERTHNGMAPGPCNAFVYDAPHGPGTMPLWAAQLKR